MTTLKHLLLATSFLTVTGFAVASAAPQDGAHIRLAQQQPPAPDAEKKPDGAPDKRKPGPPPQQRAAPPAQPAPPPQQRAAPPAQPAPPPQQRAAPPAQPAPPPAAQPPRAPQPPAAQSPQPPEQRQRPAQTPPSRQPEPAQTQPPAPRQVQPPAARQAPPPTAQETDPQRRIPPGQLRREDIERMQEERRRRQQPSGQPAQTQPAPAPQGQPAPAPQRQPAQTLPAPAPSQPPAAQTDRPRPGVPPTADQDRRPRPDERRPGQVVPPPPQTTQPGMAPQPPASPQTTQPAASPQTAPAPAPQASGPEPQRIEQLRGQRREERRDGRLIIHEGNRTIVRDGERTIIQRVEGDRFRRFSRDVRTERRGNEIYSVAIRPDGIQVVTVTDADGRLLRRLRRDRSGREIVIIDNRYGGPARAGSYFVTLPPPRIRIPRERYIVEAYDAPPALIYETLVAPPVDYIERPYTLDEIRYSPDVRDRMPRIDLDTVTFDTGSWEVTPDQIDRLEPIANAMLRAIERNPQEVYLVEGHTDAVGSDIDNLSLSDRRAEAVANILTEVFGVPPENMVTQGYGEQYLKIPTEGPERRNRRVTVRRITPLLAGGQPPQ
jgi:outer membrane protein OmpA-like peptidoglycan-associated protein